MTSNLSPEEFASRAARLKLLLLDVDGVLTDGIVYIGSDGHEAKAFSIRDGASIAWAQRSGLEVALLSGRPSEATARRAAELGIKAVIQVGPEKRAPFRKLLEDRKLDAGEVAYMGDDLLDLPVLRQAGLSAAPADAASAVRERVHWISTAGGGRGAVREFIEALLRARQSWDGIISRHLD
jgi:3-deoxy-D-manno-octulosonate 8-phosphate phosphatase (KDO 8-P phosphatase)